MKSASVVIMEAADMSVGMTGHLGMLLSEELEIGTVMTVDSITIPAEVSVSNAEYPRVVEVAEDPTPDHHLAETADVTDPLLGVMVAAMVDAVVVVVVTTILTIMVTTGIAPHATSVTLLKGMSA